MSTALLFVSLKKETGGKTTISKTPVNLFVPCCLVLRLDLQVGNVFLHSQLGKAQV